MHRIGQSQWTETHPEYQQVLAMTQGVHAWAGKVPPGVLTSTPMNQHVVEKFASSWGAATNYMTGTQLTTPNITMSAPVLHISWCKFKVVANGYPTTLCLLLPKVINVARPLVGPKGITLNVYSLRRVPERRVIAWQVIDDSLEVCHITIWIHQVRNQICYGHLCRTEK